MKSLASMLQGHSIAAAITAVENEIKGKPADADLRAALVQLLCLSGNWTRANAQLKSRQALKPIAQPTTLLLMQSVNAELQRRGGVRRHGRAGAAAAGSATAETDGAGAASGCARRGRTGPCAA